MNGRNFQIASGQEEIIGIGMLGAVGSSFEGAKEARLAMIERRILRIEMLLRNAGIEPESIKLPL